MIEFIKSYISKYTFSLVATIILVILRLVGVIEWTWMCVFYLVWINLGVEIINYILKIIKKRKGDENGYKKKW